MEQPTPIFHLPRVNLYLKLQKQKCHACHKPIWVGPYCERDLSESMHLRIAQSQLGDFLGVYADNPLAALTGQPVFQTDDFIAEYQGELIHEHELNKRYQEHCAPYTIQYLNEWYMDSARRRSVASMINDGRPLHQNNAAFTLFTGKYDADSPLPHLRKRGDVLRYFQLVVTALCPIYHGDEIYVDYGDEYWEGQTIDQHWTSDLQIV